MKLKKIGIFTAFIVFFSITSGWCNQAPTTFNLLSPANEAKNLSPILILDWEDSEDPEKEAITYAVYISRNIDFSESIIKENLTASTCLVDDNLNDEDWYYWKVQAVDDYGAITEAGPWKFLIGISPVDVVVRGFVFDKLSKNPIPDATLIYGTKSIKAGSDGSYLATIAFTETYLVTVSADGYITSNPPFEITGVSEGAVVPYDFGLDPDPNAELGDVDGQNGVTLVDAILALKILTDTDTSPVEINIQANVDTDNAIGLAEIIYILKKIAN